MTTFVNSFEIGCDPEFLVLKKTSLLALADAVPPSIERLLVVSPFLGANDQPVGWDHSGRCVELRPEKAKGAYTLVKRLQQSILSSPKLDKLKGYRWRAGAYWKEPGCTITLGGHVHFNLTPQQMPLDMINALDEVTRLLEQLDILPTHESTSRRHSGAAMATGYGKFGDYRADTPDNHVEYRTMASWLHSPWAAFAALTLAKLAAVSPSEAIDSFKGKKDFAALTNFVTKFKTKDHNAARLLNILQKYQSKLIMDPTEDFKKNWEVAL